MISWSPIILSNQSKHSQMLVSGNKNWFQHYMLRCYINNDNQIVSLIDKTLKSKNKWNLMMLMLARESKTKIFKEVYLFLTGFPFTTVFPFDKIIVHFFATKIDEFQNFSFIGCCTWHIYYFRVLASVDCLFWFTETVFYHPHKVPWDLFFREQCQATLTTKINLFVRLFQSSMASKIYIAITVYWFLSIICLIFSSVTRSIQ